MTSQTARRLFRPLTATLMCAVLAGCISSENTNAVLEVQPAAASKAADAAVVNSTCRTNVAVTRNNALVADRINPGDTHYIEFRLRPSPVLPSGHMFVVYGELDEKGVPRTYHYTGLYPRGSFAGLYTGIILPVPISADLEPSILDCDGMPASAYRRSLNASQYEALVAKVAEYKISQPKWAMLSNNCNHYAASLGVAAGLKAPEGTRSLQFLSAQYFGELVAANGDTIRSRKPASDDPSR